MLLRENRSTVRNALDEAIYKKDKKEGKIVTLPSSPDYLARSPQFFGPSQIYLGKRSRRADRLDRLLLADDSLADEALTYI